MRVRRSDTTLLMRMAMGSDHPSFSHTLPINYQLGVDHQCIHEDEDGGEDGGRDGGEDGGRDRGKDGL